MFSVSIETRRPLTSGIFSAQISSKKTTGQQICSLLTLFNIPIYEVCRKFDKNCIKNFWKILGFLSFSVSIWYIFHLENSHYLFGKAYWTTNSCHSCHVKRFQHSNPRSLSKIWKKLHKNVKNRKILEFFYHFWGKFFRKNAFISLKNTLGQRVRALLNVFNILIHDVYRKNDKNCIKTLKVEKFWNFCHFFGNFSFKKPHLSHQNTIGQRIRALLNVFNILIHDVYRKNDKNCIKTLKVEKFWNFCHFFGNFSFKKPHLSHQYTIGQRIRALLNVFNILIDHVYRKKWQKMHENGENWESFEFLSFSGSFWVIMGSFPSLPKKSKNLYKYISHGTKFMSVEFCECTSSYYVNNNNSWQIL